MYRNIEINLASGTVYVVKLDVGVGATELCKALELSNPSLAIKDIGVFTESLVIEEGSIIIVISSTSDAMSHVKRISQMHPGIEVRHEQAFSAYSLEYETKHKLRKELIEAGFDYKGLNYQIDSDSRINITGKALELQLDTTIESVNWVSNTKDGEGNDIVPTLTRDEFIEFAKEVASYYESIILGANNAT